MIQQDSESKVFSQRLWEFLLSSNACSPGCGCKDDFFEQTSAGVRTILSKKPSSLLVQLKDELKSLIRSEELSLSDATDDVAIDFPDVETLKGWLAVWHFLIGDIKGGSANQPEVLKEIKFIEQFQELGSPLRSPKENPTENAIDIKSVEALAKKKSISTKAAFKELSNEKYQIRRVGISAQWDELFLALKNFYILYGSHL